MQNFDIFFPAVVAFLATVTATPICIYFIKKLNLFDDPKKHKHPAVIHKFPVPRGGGIPLFIGVFVAGFFFLPVNQITISLFVAALISLVIGTLDDKYDISPYVRFFGNLVAAIIVVSSGITIPFVTNPFGGVIRLDTIAFSFTLLGTPITIALSGVIAVLWIVWMMNMLNWSKGVDGQMPGIVAISAVVIGILSLRFAVLDQDSQIAAILSFSLAGSALGFLIFNYYPAKIFPGYGATAIYLLLSAASILSSAKIATAFLVMGLPLIDGTFTIARRMLSGKSPFWHDKKHLHHLLLQMGLSQRRVALCYWIISAILGLLSLALPSSGKTFAIVMLVVVVGGILLFLHLALRKHEKKSL